MGNIDHSPVYAPFFNTKSYSRIKDSNTSLELYVATTGSDSNNGMTALTPFLTIQKAIDTIGASLEPGKITIHVADGTYNEDLRLKDCLGKFNDSVTGGLFTSQSGLGPNFIEVRGNTATPSNVIIVGSGAVNGTISALNQRSVWRFNGFEIRNDNTVNNAAFWVDNSTVLIQNCNSAQVGNFVYAQNHALVILEQSTAGMVHAVKSTFLFAWVNSNILSYQDMTVTGFTGFAMYASYDSTIGEYGSSFGYATTFSFSGSNAAAICQASNNGTVEGFYDVTIAASGCSGPFHRVLGGGKIVFYGLCTVNATNLTGGFLYIVDNSTFQDFFDSTWNALGTTPATYTVYDSSVVLTTNNFSGASIVFGEYDTNYKYAFDNRYVTSVLGTHSGTLPLGTTAYFGQGQLQASLITLYIARQDEKVTDFNIRMETGNGAAHTDDFTVVKNGVDTAMTVSITNGQTGSTTSNAVTLAAGDTLAIKAETDAATAGANVSAQLTIIKI